MASLPAADQPLARDVHPVELPVAVLEVERDRALAFVARARPGIGNREVEAVEPEVAEMAAVDVRRAEAAAVALGRPRLELAGTAIVAIAVAEIDALESPVDHCFAVP